MLALDTGVCNIPVSCDCLRAAADATCDDAEIIFDRLLPLLLRLPPVEIEPLDDRLLPLPLPDAVSFKPC
jgi:hypothetical protein